MKEPKERILFDNYDGYYDLAKESLTEDDEREITDEVIWEYANLLSETEWEDFKINFESFMNGDTFILQGAIGRWDGIHRGGFTFNSFNELSKAWEDCAYIKVYDENGHLYIDCSHHDGTNHYEIKQLNDKGEDYLNNHYYDDEREVHDKLMKAPYSVLPRFAEKVWGCPRQEWID